MLIHFSFSNVYSYRDPTEFSMVAGRSSSHKESRLAVPGHPHLHVLPLAAIYGGNASGKSNFARALYLFKSCVLLGKPLYIPFVLDSAMRDEPSQLEVTLMAGGNVWEFSLSIARSCFLKEQLRRIDGHQETLVYQREQGKKFSFDRDFFAEDAGFVQEFAERLEDNFLFLTKIHTMVHGKLDPVFNWFLHTLCVVGMDELQHHLDTKTGAYEKALAMADTGIDGLKKTRLPLEQSGFTQEDIDAFRQSEQVISPMNEEMVFLQKEGSDLVAYQCMAMHQVSHGGGEAHFDFWMESDGSRRFFELLPTLLEDEENPRVYVIDELDRSLHYGLAKAMIAKQRELAARGVVHQVIFTTHNLMLMDQDILRKDEMWATERRPDHSSELISFFEFKEIRKDKNIRKSYLEGRFGGLPDIQF